MKNHASRPFLGTTRDVNHAFPDLDEVSLKISQDPYGYYCKSESHRISFYTKETLQSHVPCVNPKCQQGGLSVQSIVAFSSDGDYDFPCNGHEGTPRGRRRGDPCDNRFKVTLKILRKGIDSA